MTDAASIAQLPLGHVGIITDAFSLIGVRCQQVPSLRQRLHLLANAGEKGKLESKDCRVHANLGISKQSAADLALANLAMRIKQLESGLGNWNLDPFPSHDAPALLLSQLDLSAASRRHNDKGEMTHPKTAGLHVTPAARSSISRLRFGKHGQQCGVTSHSNASLGKQDAASHKVNVPPASWSARPVA